MSSRLRGIKHPQSYIMNSTNSTISTLITDLKCGTYENDIKIEFDGYMHGKTGFRLTISEMDHINDTMVTQWKKIIAKHGYTARFSYDIDHGWANIVCTKDTKKLPYMFFLYLSISMACIAWTQF